MVRERQRLRDPVCSRLRVRSRSHVQPIPVRGRRLNAPAAPRARPHTQQFRRAARPAALSADQKRRQAVVTAAAWKSFGAGASMIAFLNAEHAGLGGRPMDLAVNSDAGLAAVLDALPTPEAPAVPDTAVPDTGRSS